MRTVILALALLTIQSLSAQYVTIPDANFRNFLQQNYPSCFNGNGQMDTTCQAISTVYLMNCSNRFISDLEGVQYFTDLLYLYAADNQMTHLPLLPNTLVDVNVRGNQLSTIAGLPASLSYFDCTSNMLSNLPALPLNLIDIKCYDNLLTSLPALPNTLESIQCYNNQLTNLPTLPNSLITLTYF